MPSSVTHSYFALDVYEKLSTHCKNKIKSNLESYKMFAQGSDPFMFYHFFIGSNAKRVAQLQNQMHHTKTRDFFIAIMTFIHKQKLVDHSEAMSYLYGHICHYYLDVFTHPFIHYKAGKFRSKDKKTYRYNALHQEIEYRIDSYFIENKLAEDPQKFRMDRFIIDLSKISFTLDELIEESIGRVYGVKNSAHLYYRSIWYMYYFFRIFNYDPHGRKLKLYRLIDKVTPKRMIRLEELSYYNTYSDQKDYLNLKHKKWHYPWDKSKVFHYSFLELYEMALQQTVATIEEVTVMLEQTNLNLEQLQKIFKNLSFSTGLDCEKTVEMKYFEF